MWRGGALHRGAWGGIPSWPSSVPSASSQPACLPRRRRGAGKREGSGPGRQRREALSRAGGGVTPGQCPPVPSSGFKIAVVSFVQHEKKPQDQLLEKWV